MYETQNLVYLALPKTGTTTISRCLWELFGARLVGSKHGRLPGPTDKWVVGSIRNPWDYYVSLWAFGCQGKGGLYNRLTRSLSWLQLTRGATTHSLPSLSLAAKRVFAVVQTERNKSPSSWSSTYVPEAAAFRRWLRRILDPDRAYELSLPYGASSVPEQAGLLTFRYLWLYARDVRPLRRPGAFASLADLRSFDREQNRVDSMIHTETLIPDLRAVLQRTQSLSASDEKRLEDWAAQGKRNASSHLPAKELYDDATAQLVFERERLIVDKYAYERPWTARR